MTEVQYFCGKEQRRELVRATANLNGIDFIEVDHPSQTVIRVTFLKAPAGLDVSNFVLEGGVRVKNIKLLALNVAGNVGTLTADQRGDFSTYTLRLVSGPGDDSPPVGFDGHLCALDFSFKVQCPTDFDCQPQRDCEPSSGPGPIIDYLSKDYASFRRLMLDRLSVTMPDWKERSAADIQIAIVELLAYIGDELSYYQDSVATEAYLGTARRRESVRRHARLLDYFVHEGCNARAYICLEVLAGSSADGATLPTHTVFLDRTSGDSTRLARATYASYGSVPVAFESLHALKLSSAKNKIQLYTWSDFDCCLPAGATRATILRTPNLELHPGDLLAFYEAKNPVGGSSNGPDPSHRHVVRIKTVDPAVDALTGDNLYEVTWFAEDALPFPLCLSITHGEQAITDVSIACANVVLADQGQTLGSEFLIPDQPSPNERYLPTLRSVDLTFSNPYGHDEAVLSSAAAGLRSDPHTAVAAVELSSTTGKWQVLADLLGSGEFDRDVVVEVENDRSVRFRFGDDTNGMQPNPGDQFSVIPRTGNGCVGNVGRDVLTRVVFDTEGIVNVWNPLPAAGGAEPEKLEEVRQFAPEAFKLQERAVTELDYAAMAKRHAEVQNAFADFRWTGSWYTVFLAIDRVGGSKVLDDPEFKASMLAHMDRYRMAGVDIELRDPKFVSLEIVLRVCVTKGYLRSEVRRRLERAFGQYDLGRGDRGFFHPDNFSFGQDVYLSQVLQVAMEIEGVDHVRAEVFKRWGQTPNQEIEKGRISIAASEIARLANDSSLPEDGRITFILEGGL